MNLRGKIVSVLSAVVLSAGVVAPAFAQGDRFTNTTDINVDIGAAEDGGALEFSFVQNIPFPNVPFSNADQTIRGGITVSVQDTRGRSQGWQLGVQSEDFTTTGSDDRIPVGNLTMEPGAVTRVSGDARLPQVATPFQMSTGMTTLLTAPQGTGNGRYSVPVTGTLLIPGGTDIGTYKATLVGELSSAP